MSRSKKDCSCGGVMWDVSFRLREDGWNVPLDNPYYVCNTCLKKEKMNEKDIHSGEVK